MKKLLLTLAAAGLSTSLAWADLTVVQKVEGGGLEGEMTIKFKGKKVRADVATPISTITDAETGDTLTLQHRTKTFTRTTAEQTKSLMEQMLKAQGANEPPKLTPTKEQKEIAGQKTQAYDWAVGKLKIRFWVAPEYPNAAAIQEQLDLMQNSGLAGVAATMMPSPQQMPGVRLRTELDLAGQKVNTTIVSIKQDAVDAAIFEVPKSYKEVAMPVTGSGTEE
jgi:hypothetical protein